MSIANIISRFVLLCGMEQSEVYKWRSLIDDAVDYVSSVVIKSELSEGDTRRLEMLCAVYAFKLYSICNEEGFSSFSVGDVRASLPTETLSKAEKLWNEYYSKSMDLVCDKKFLFGRVI